MKAIKKAARDRPECGTRRGHSKHTRFGEHQCNKCLDYQSRRAAAYKIRRYDQDKYQLPVVTIGLWLMKLHVTDEAYYQQARADLGEELADACLYRAENDV